MNMRRREMVLRHLKRQEALIAHQKEIIDRLAVAGQPTRLAEDALETMERTLAINQSEGCQRSN